MGLDDEGDGRGSPDGRRAGAASASFDRARSVVSEWEGVGGA